MKKSIALLLTVMLIFGLAACSANKQNAFLYRKELRSKVRWIWPALSVLSGKMRRFTALMKTILP